MGIKKAFITLLSTENYLPAVLVLKRSMEEVNTTYPLICAVTENIYNDSIVSILTQHNIIIEKIPKLEYNEEVRKRKRGWATLNTASKISLFDLKQYNKLCYIDSDTFLLQNIDDVFDWPDGSMIEPTPDEKQDSYGFSALFVFQPKYHRSDFYKCLLKNFPYFDGELLGNLWFYTRTSLSHRIPYIYCMHYSYAAACKLFLKENPQEYEIKFKYPKVIHFCNKEKPWLKKYKKDFLEWNPIIDKYRIYLSEINLDKNY